MTYQEYLNQIPVVENKEKIDSLIKWTLNEFPNLTLEMKWNQPMLIDHGTYIISYGCAKKHISVAPEKTFLDRNINEISKYYKSSKMLFKIDWNDDIEYDLLKKLIVEIIEEKKDYDRFWL